MVIVIEGERDVEGYDECSPRQLGGRDVSHHSILDAHFDLIVFCSTGSLGLTRYVHGVKTSS